MKDDKCDHLSSTLQLQEEMVSSLTSDKTRADKETASRMANLNQALAQAKQSCAQLTEEIETHKAKEWELAQKVEDLQLAAAAAKVTPSKAFREREGLVISGTPVRSRMPQSNCNSSRLFMHSDTEIDSLRTENKKLKQDLSCLQTNFEFTTRKTAQLRSDMKEMESAMSELQGQFDGNLTDKEELQAKYDELVSDRNSKGNSQALLEKKQVLGLAQQVKTLETELEKLQQQNLDLQAQLKCGLDRTMDTQNMLEKLDSVKQSLSNEKSVMDGEMDGLREELERLQGKCQDLESSTNTHQEEKRKSVGTIKALKSKISKLNREKSELSEQLVMASEKLDQVHDKIRLHVEEVKALKVNLKAKEKEILLLSSRKRDQADIPVEMKKLRAKVVETIDEMSELRSRKDSYQVAKESLEGKVADLRKANANLMRESKHASELTLKVNAELERMEDKAQGLEGDLEAERKQHAGTKRKLGEAEMGLSGIADVKAECEAELGKLLDRLSESEQRNFELTTELTSCRKEAGVVKETHSDIEQKLMALEENIDAAEFALLERESQLSDMNCAYELMEAENSTLLTQVTSLSEMVSTRNFKLEAQQAHCIQHESEYLEIMANISQLENEHGNCASVIQKLRETNDQLKESLETDESLKREMEGTISSLKRNIKELDQSFAILKKSKSDIQDQLAMQTSKYKDLSQKHGTSEARVRQLEQDFRVESISLVAARDDLNHTRKMNQQTKAELSEKVEALETKLTDMALQHSAFHRDRVELKSRVTDLRAELKEQVLLSSSLKIQRDSLSEQYESLKESALSVLQSDTPLDATMTFGEENLPTTPPKGLGKGKGKSRREPKGILKTRKVLNPVQNL